MQYTEGYLIDERYALKRFIGSGSFGEVWLADDKATDLEVAVKIYIAMDDEGLSDFKKEFTLSFNLNHTNLLHANYLGVSTQDKRPYLVMPFCPDGSASKFAGKMEEKELWKFIHDVASGLAYLHEQNPPIIHQDIKPDNILILKSGDYVITDFGISKQLKSTLRKSASQMNSTGSIAYMGPERFSKQYMAVKASDIWSLGVTIYELIYNDMPFCGMGGSMQRQGADIPDLPEEFSKEMKLIFTSCLAKETWNRPSARQIADFATHYLAGEPLKVTWNYDGPQEFLPESSTINSVEEQPQTNAPQNAFGETVKMSGRDNNSAGGYTVQSGPSYGGSSGGYSNIPSQPSVVSSPLPIWSYFAAAVLGLLSGVVLRLFL